MRATQTSSKEFCKPPNISNLRLSCHNKITQKIQIQTSFLLKHEERIEKVNTERENEQTEYSNDKKVCGTKSASYVMV